MTKAHDTQHFTQQKGNAWTSSVTSMKTVDEFRAVIATLVTGAKIDDAGNKMTAQCHIMMNALDEFDFAPLQKGTLIY